MTLQNGGVTSAIFVPMQLVCHTQVFSGMTELNNEIYVRGYAVNNTGSSVLGLKFKPEELIIPEVLRRGLIF